MNIYKFFIISALILTTSLSYSETKKVILFLESLDGISPKVIRQVANSDGLCFCTKINNPKSVAASVKELIMTNKIEPALFLEEPYFPLVSEKIHGKKNINIDLTDDLTDLISRYKKSFKGTFEKRKFGLFLKDGIFTDATLQIFYSRNVSWFTTTLTNNKGSRLYFDRGTAVFVPYLNFPSAVKDIKQWLAEKKAEFIPILITSNSIKNENFMTYLLNFLEKSPVYETYLPINAAYITARNYKDTDPEIITVKKENIPYDILLKLTNAAKETKLHDTEEEKETYTILSDELSSMYSSKIITGILNNDPDSQKLFDISYSNIFKFSGKEIPDEDSLVSLNSQENIAEEENIPEVSFVKTGSSYKITNEDVIKSMSVKKGVESVNLGINYDAGETDYITIYIDMNGIANTGCQYMLDKTGFFVPENCWEYALKIKDNICEVYRFASDTITKVQTINMTSPNSVAVPNTVLRGTPYNWNYQTVAVKENNIVDFIETNKEKKEKIFKSKPILLRMISIQK